MEESKSQGPGNKAYREDQRFRAEERLRKRSDFLRTQRRGTRQSGQHLVVYAKPNDLAWTRLGVTVSRKVGNAVIRNAWKRRLRELFRRNKLSLPAGFDVVVIVKASGSPPDFDRLGQEFIRLTKRAATRPGRKGA